MKSKVFIAFILAFISNIEIIAQYTNSNSFMRRAIVEYKKDSKGFFLRSSDFLVDEVNHVKEVYAFDKESQNIYVCTSFGIYVISLNKDYAKVVKKNKEVPKLDIGEITRITSYKKYHLDSLMQSYNKARRDSLLEVQYKKEREDSIARAAKEAQKMALAVQDSLNRARYMSEHRKSSVPICYNSLNCLVCKENIARDSLSCFKVNNDSIYFITLAKGYYSETFPLFHVALVPKSLATNEDFQYHMQVYGDSLSHPKTDVNIEDVASLSSLSIDEHIESVRKIVPYGYVGDWGWGDEYGCVSFHINYTNMNKNTIKYLDVFWYVINDVNDLCGKGKFRGVGPVKMGKTARWNWDSSSYYVSRDASTMKISKIVITYMNGRQQVMNRNMIKYGDSDEKSDDGMNVEYGTHISRLKDYKISIPRKIFSYTGEIYDNTQVETPAYYPGGSNALNAYFKENMIFPSVAMEQEIQGEVVLKCLVETDGTINEIKVEKSLSRECDDEAKRIARQLKFIPAKIAGNPVRVYTSIPFKFYRN